MIKLFEEYANIESICDKYKIENYRINSDGSVSVNGSVIISDRELTKIPLKFRRVNGVFNCNNNQLTSLEGCPNYVGDIFACAYNSLTSLKYCPTKVGNSFNCSNNQLTSLEGCPEEIVGSSTCSINKLTSLKGCPKRMGRSFGCSDNLLTSLKDAPYVDVNFIDNGLLFNCYRNPFPKLIMDNIGCIIDILKYQHDYSIWNIDGSLNEYRFKDMMEEIREIQDDY